MSWSMRRAVSSEWSFFLAISSPRKTGPESEPQATFLKCYPMPQSRTIRLAIPVARLKSSWAPVVTVPVKSSSATRPAMSTAS